MISVQLILYAAAVVVLLIGAIADPLRFNVSRCIALALALYIVAQLPIGR